MRNRPFRTGALRSAGSLPSAGFLIAWVLAAGAAPADEPAPRHDAAEEAMTDEAMAAEAAAGGASENQATESEMRDGSTTDAGMPDDGVPDDGVPDDGVPDDGVPDDSLEARCQREVEELHAFFRGWFLGSIPDDDASYARLVDVLADEFVIVTPSGDVTEREEFVDRLRETHGDGKALGDAGLEIEIRNFRFLFRQDDIAVVMYEEWQVSRGPQAHQFRGRRSSAVFREVAGQPNGVEWVHLHQTWLPRE